MKTNGVRNLNLYLLIVRYSSKERLSKFFRHFKVNTSESVYSTLKELQELTNFNENKFFSYFSKRELINLCKIFDLISIGNKPVLWERLLSEDRISKNFHFNAKNGYEMTKREEEITDSIIKRLEEQFFSDVGSIVLKFVDYKSCTYEKAINRIRKKYSKKSREEIEYAFNYITEAYNELAAIIKVKIGTSWSYWDRWGSHNSKPLHSFEQEFLNKYPKIPISLFRGLFYFHVTDHYIR